MNPDRGVYVASVFERLAASELTHHMFHSYCAAVKNITVSVDDEVYHAARVKAAELRTSVSVLVRNYLEALRRGQAPVQPQDEEAHRKNRAELVRLFREANLILGYQPNREKTYER